MKKIKEIVDEVWNFLRNFTEGEFWKYYLLIILGTYIIVISNFDWQYNLWVHKYINTKIDILTYSDMLGFLFVPLLFITLGFTYFFYKEKIILQLMKLSFVTITASLIFSVIIKIFAGRVSPPHFHTGNINGLERMQNWTDNSLDFNFGFLNEQVFGGYPSSHATIYFALAYFAFYYFNQFKFKYSKLIIYSCFALAIFISFGVSFGHHWFSEIFAGSILGYVIGKNVFKNFKNL